MDNRLISAKVIITSVTYFSNNKFNYSAVRSVFNPRERLLQTIETINSLKEFIPNPEICLIEGGMQDIGSNLNKLDIKYKYLGSNWMIKLLVNSQFKGIGEVALLLYVLIFMKIPLDGFIWKISGRYKLNSDFNLLKWNFNLFNFRKYENSYSTRLYGFPGAKRWYFVFYLLSIIPKLLKGESIEGALYRTISTSKVNLLDILGVEGMVGNYGNEIKE